MAGLSGSLRVSRSIFLHEFFFCHEFSFLPRIHEFFLPRITLIFTNFYFTNSFVFIGARHCGLDPQRGSLSIFNSLFPHHFSEIATILC